MKEKLTTLIIKKANNDLDLISLRGEGKLPHSACSATDTSNIGDFIFWHDTTMYGNKHEGVVIAKRTCMWDMSKPTGQRESDVEESTAFKAAFDNYRNHNTYSWF